MTGVIHSRIDLRFESGLQLLIASLKLHCWFSSGLMVSSKQTLAFVTRVQIEHALPKAISRGTPETLKTIYLSILMLRNSHNASRS